jgi:23S rRNA (cytosine1962-C5)-methyltransferase
MDKQIFEQRRKLVLKPGKERVLANRHPWIFAGAIARESGPPEAAVADLIDEDGGPLACGFYSPHSQIRLRAMTFGGDALTAELLESRISAAIARRQPILDQGTNAARLINAEGDDLSALVVDCYNDVLVVEIANYGVERIAPLVIDVLQRDLAPRLIYFKNDLPARRIEQLTAEPRSIGDGDPRTTILEQGAGHRHRTAQSLSQRLRSELRRGRCIRIRAEDGWPIRSPDLRSARVRPNARRHRPGRARLQGCQPVRHEAR